MKCKKYLLRHCESLEGKTVIVTGATGTIGREIVVCCLILGADIIMAVRNTVKGDAVKQGILEYFAKRKIFIDDKRITVAKLDVSDFDSTNKFAESMSGKSGFYLINNAGALSGKVNIQGKSKDTGKYAVQEYEYHYMINFLGQMYLSERLESRAEKIIFQSSLSYAWKKSRTDWQNVQSTGIRSSIKKYGRAKRLLNLTAVALGNAKFCLVHPGVCSTGIIPTRLLQILCRPVFHSARTAALCAVTALSKSYPRDYILGPRFFGIWGKPKLHKIQRSILDAEERRRSLENFEAEMVKLRDKL